MKKLSEQLLYWRSERPDEWKMDEFIRMAKALESDQHTHAFLDCGTEKSCSIVVDAPDNDGFIVVEDRFGGYHLVGIDKVFLKKHQS